ncbi:MAG: hypothetical protein OEY81_04755, partial [Candidatus Bathyarchaeota archaeon]|nr:hypothetical protein [Candidatus Bathyarchaeota archaeon]
MMSFEFPKKLPEEWIEAIERNGNVGSVIHGLKIVGKDERGTIVKTGMDSFKILHDGRNESTFGYTTKGSAEWDASSTFIIGSWATCPESGTADSITVYLKQYNTATPKIKCALYKKSDNSLVGSTEKWTLTSGWDGWKTFNFADGPSLENIDYWIVFWINAKVYAYYVTETEKRGTQYRFYNSWPNPWSPNTYDWKMSIYCTYTPAGGEIYEINVDAVVKASAEKALQTTFNIQKDAVVAGTATHGEESTLNILKDAIVKSFTDLGVETTFNIEKDALVEVLADVTVEKLAGQLFEIFKDAVVQAQATFALESNFNITNDAIVNASAIVSLETIFNVVKDAIIKTSAAPQVVGVYPINVDAAVEASATPSLQQTLGIRRDAVVVAVSTPLIQSIFNISPEAVVKVLAEVSVVKEGEVKVT